MKKVLFILLFFHLTLIFSQDQNNRLHYQVIFSGLLSSEQKNELESRLMHTEFVLASKIFYKPEKNAGEIILEVSREIRQKGEEINEFNPSKIKNILSEFGLETIEFNRKD